MNGARLIVRQLELGPMMNYVYIVGCAATREGAVIDPGWDVPRILRIARELRLRIRKILLTHAHPDHINGLEELWKATGSPIFMNVEEIAFIGEMARRFEIPIGFFERTPARAVADDEEIALGDLKIRCLHTPGHSPGSQCFLIENSLFSGDTLFVDACGRVDLPGGDPEKMQWSLSRRLASLDDETVLYPGHNYGGRPTSTIGEQKRTNPCMQPGFFHS